MTDRGASGLEERLTRDFGYPPNGARAVASRLTAMTGPVDEAFRSWWATGVTPEIEIEGFTVDRLREEHGMNEIAALLTLDWLNRDPIAAAASLHKGHDVVRRRSTDPAR
jgi:hypothetical protein